VDLSKQSADFIFSHALPLYIEPSEQDERQETSHGEQTFHNLQVLMPPPVFLKDQLGFFDLLF
jgi:hypothetical protein